jgi:sugar (pentulose or hexulose) kinase
MALNFTPLTAYRIEVMDGIRQRAENQRRMGEGLGAILGAAKGAYDAQKTRDFFAQFDDSEELSAIDEQIKENEEQIEKLNAELEALGG